MSDKIYILEKDDSTIELEAFGDEELRIKVWDYELADIYISKKEAKEIADVLLNWVNT